MHVRLLGKCADVAVDSHAGVAHQHVVEETNAAARERIEDTVAVAVDAVHVRVEAIWNTVAIAVFG